MENTSFKHNISMTVYINIKYRKWKNQCIVIGIFGFYCFCKTLGSVHTIWTSTSSISPSLELCNICNELHHLEWWDRASRRS